MDIAIVWLSLAIYVVIIFKAKIIDKKERKWVFLFIILTIGCTVLTGLHLSLNSVTSFLNDSFGRLSRMVVNI